MYFAFTAAFITPRPELPVSLGGYAPRMSSSFVADLYRATASFSVRFRPRTQRGSVMSTPAIEFPVQDPSSPWSNALQCRLNMTVLIAAVPAENARLRGSCSTWRPRRPAPAFSLMIFVVIDPSQDLFGPELIRDSSADFCRAFLSFFVRCLPQSGIRK